MGNVCVLDLEGVSRVFKIRYAGVCRQDGRPRRGETAL